jgi:hypothetical protein
MSGDLAYLGLAEAAELIRAKRLSPVEYVTALLARIERHDGKYNAFISLTPERALTAARAAEAEIMAGRWRGPFHGMPYALKDIIDVEGSRDHGTFQDPDGRCRPARRGHGAARSGRRGSARQALDPRIRHWRPFRSAGKSRPMDRESGEYRISRSGSSTKPASMTSSIWGMWDKRTPARAER